MPVGPPGWRRSDRTPDQADPSRRNIARVLIQMLQLFHRPLEPAALFGHGAMSDLSPLSGVKRKLDFGAVRAAFDPTRTSAHSVEAGNLLRQSLSGHCLSSAVPPRMVERFPRFPTLPEEP